MCVAAVAVRCLHPLASSCASLTGTPSRVPFATLPISPNLYRTLELRFYDVSKGDMFRHDGTFVEIPAGCLRWTIALGDADDRHVVGMLPARIIGRVITLCSPTAERGRRRSTQLSVAAVTVRCRPLANAIDPFLNGVSVSHRRSTMPTRWS